MQKNNVQSNLVISNSDELGVLFQSIKSYIEFINHSI